MGDLTFPSFVGQDGEILRRLSWDDSIETGVVAEAMRRRLTSTDDCPADLNEVRWINEFSNRRGDPNEDGLFWWLLTWLLLAKIFFNFFSESPAPTPLHFPLPTLATLRMPRTSPHVLPLQR